MGVWPPIEIPRVPFETDAQPVLFRVKFPKSVASPVDAIVIKSIVSLDAGFKNPPQNIPRVLDDVPPS